MEGYRVFLSSPTDVQVERERAELVIKRLNAERVDHPQFELVRWEQDYYRAEDDFQAQIPEPAQCDLVICIFWKRLGTELPDKYGRPDGTIPTGTEFEFENAISAALEHKDKLPDVLVYRKMAEVKFSLDMLELEKAQYDRFMAFWQRWFRNEKGHFVAGFQSFSDPDDFETTFERNVRAWLGDREGNVAWTQGSPYRGLEPFDVQHATVFFGRRREVERTRARFIASAMAGHPFLLVSGASGSGKSSLARAGLIPRLAQVGGLSTWAATLRWTVVTPGQIADDWPGGMARALFEKNALGDELRLGDFNETAKLAPYIALADATIALPLGNALARVGQKLAAEQGRATPPRAALLILVDQLEEIFAWPREKARMFLRFLHHASQIPDLAVAVVATMRSDFLHRIIEFPEFEALSGRTEIRGPDETERTLELKLPSAADLRDIILQPARAGRLEFEAGQSPHRDLAGVIEAEARPEAMPAVQLLLAELYNRRRGNMLTLEAYDALGGVDGVMAKRGEDAYHSVDPAARAAFPRIVRALVTQAGADVPASARRVSEEVFAGDAAAGALVSGLRDARLIISDRGELRFTHDSILKGWGRLRDQIAEERRLFGARDRLEQYCRRWAEAPREPANERNRFLLEGFQLAEGRELLAKWGAAGLADKQAALPAYIAASDAREKRARRVTQAIAWSVALVFAALSVLLFDQWRTTAKAQKETQAALWIANSQSYLRDAKVAPALDAAGRAFASLPSEASRSALLSALMEVSPHLVTTASLGADTAEALVWMDDGTLAFASKSGKLRMLATAGTSAGKGPSAWTLPAIKRQQDGNPAVVRALRPLGPDRVAAIFDEGSIALLGHEQSTGALRDKPTQETSINPTAHGAAISPDGALLIMAGVEETITLSRCDWTKTAARPCSSAPLTGARGRAVAISHDGQRIAVGDQSGTVTVYDAAGRRIGDLVIAGGAILSLGWAANGNWLAAGTAGGDILILDLSSGTPAEAARQRVGDRPISVLAWHPKHLALAFSCHGATVCFWRFRTGVEDAAQLMPIIRFAGHTNAVTRLAWAPGGAHLASAAADATIRIWSTDQNRDATFALYAEDAADLSTVATSPDGRWVAAGGRDGSIRLWDARMGAPGRVVTPAGGEVHALAWSPNGLLAAFHENDAISVVPADAEKPVLPLQAPAGAGSRLTWIDGGRTLAVVMREGGEIALIGTEQRAGEQPAYLPSPVKDHEPWGVAVDPAGKTLFASYTNGEVYIWDLASKTLTGSMRHEFAKEHDRVGAGSLSISPDGRWLATSGGGRFLWIYDIAGRALSRTMATESGEAVAVSFSPDGRGLAALGADNRLYVWDMDRDSATRLAAVSAVPSRETSGESSKRLEHASWFGWVTNDSIAVASGTSAITILSLDEAAWTRRAGGLAAGPANP